MSGSPIRGLKGKRVDWLKNGVYMVQEADTPHGIRGYGADTRETERYFREGRSSATLNRLQAAGVNMVMLNVHCSRGLKNEWEQVESAKAFAEEIHARGMKVGAYVNVLAIDTAAFLLEQPDAQSWLQIEENGQNPTYYDNYHLNIFCLNNEAFLQYFEKILTVTVRDVKADLVFIDDFGYYSYSCICDNCKRAFREYLEAKYPTPEARLERFSMPSVEHVEPPPFRVLGGNAFGPWEESLGLLVRDPVQQEWIDFRCHRMGEVSERLNKCVKKWNPDVAFAPNVPYVGPVLLNNALFHGAWPTKIYPHADVITAECGMPLHLDKHGVVRGRVPYLKIARAFDCPGLVHYIGRRQHFTPLAMVETMVYGYAPNEDVGDIFFPSFPEDCKKYLDFYREHIDLYVNAKTAADVALLHSYTSLSYITGPPLNSLRQFEQVLFQEKIPYDFIFDEDLVNISNHPVLALPNVASMSEEQVKQVSDYVLNGGSAVATDQTSLLDDRLRRWRGRWFSEGAKPTYALGEALGIDWPDKGVIKANIGAGRLAVVARIVPGSEGASDTVVQQEGERRLRYSEVPTARHSFGPSMPMVPNFLLPRNRDEIVDAINWAAGEKRRLHVEAPLFVTAELTWKTEAQRFALHLVNWKPTEPQSGIKVRLRIPKGKRISSVICRSPEIDEAEIHYRWSGDLAIFEVPELQIYDLVTISLVDK